jgi:acetyl esterase/lipase
MKSVCSLLLAFALLGSPGFGQKNYPPVIEGSTEIVYKNASDADLKLWMFKPADWQAGDTRPAIIFFFGGGWRAGSPTQFVPHSEYLAERGMVAFVADYRVASRHETQAKDCVEDARDAMKYVRAHASELGIDPDCLAAGGGSAGGHIAACLGVIEEAEGEEGSKADAIALFNPACVLAPMEGIEPWGESNQEQLKQRMGVDPIVLSPAHHITAEAAPCVAFHGTADATVPYQTTEVFCNRLKEAGVTCVLHGYEGEGHGFFNAGRKPATGDEPVLPQTLKQLDAFLVDLKWLE